MGERTKSSKKERPPTKTTVNDAPIRSTPTCPAPGYLLLGILMSLASAVTLTHLLVSSPINAVEYSLPTPPELPNGSRFLSDAEILLEDQIYGPESLALDESSGLIYTGLKTGLICELQLDGKKPRIVRAVRLTNIDGCDGSYVNMPKCGRPLGMRFDENGELLVVDAYLGLYSINWKTEKVHTLLAGGAQITDDAEEPPVRYLNDVDILPDGRIVISESSNKFDDRDFLYDMFEHRPNGRILVFNPNNGHLSVIARNLYFPNGVHVRNGKVIFAEMGMSRIMRLSPSSGEMVVLADNLPGYPDSIRPAERGGLWVAIPAGRTDGDRWLAERPKIRQLITKLVSPQALVRVAEMFTEKVGLVIKINSDSGVIEDVLSDASGRVADISTAIADGRGGLLMGSDSNYYLARVQL